MEETIEEFACDLCKEFNKNEDDNYYWLSMDSARLIVKGLVAKGYKKESDTAKEIIEWIKRNGTLGYGGYVIHDSTIEQICKKYGVDLGDSNE